MTYQFFFAQSGRFPSNMFDEVTTPTAHAAGTADERPERRSHMRLLYPSSRLLRSFFSYITHVEYCHQRACACYVTPLFRTDDRIES